MNDNSLRKWIKLSLQYLYRIRNGILLHLATCFFILLIAALYHLPMIPMLYIVLFITAMAGLFLGLGCHQFRRRMQHLILVRSGANVQLGTLPVPCDALEAIYQEILSITADRSLQAENQAEARLRRSDAYYTLWSHQAKTPLAALRLLIQEEPINPGACETELLKAEQYVEMALQYQRLRSSEKDLVLAPVSVDQVIRSTVKGLAPLFISRKLLIDIDTIGVTVLSDEKWLSFALEQILTNAAKYTPSGGVRIYLSDPHKPELCIEDSGIGIRPEDLPRVMDWGYTGQNGHKGMRSTGIGLALCRETLDMLGHRIHLESTVGKGTRVFIDFSRETMEIFS